jgi:hypothetical protein
MGDGLIRKGLRKSLMRWCEQDVAAQSQRLFYRENPVYSRAMILIGMEQIIHYVTAVCAARALAGIVGALATRTPA